MKKILFTSVIVLYIGLLPSFAQTSVPKEDCEFYNFLSKSNIKKTWYWSETIGYEYLSVKICKEDYKIIFGCSCNSDALGIRGELNGKEVTSKELNSITEKIKQAIIEKRIEKSLIRGEIMYIIKECD